MVELTLESLAERVAALERIVADRYRSVADKAVPGVRPGTGDWDAFEKACTALRDKYDFEAVRLQDELEWEEARRAVK